MNRRELLGTAAASSLAFAVVPRHVLGGAGYVAPSEKVTIANIGCGTQGLREMPGMLENPDVQIVAVCDPNKFTTNYIDWSSNGIRAGIRNTLGDPNWGAGIEGIPGGRDIGKDYVQKYYAKNKPSGTYKGCNSYEDFRDLLEQEKDLDAIKIMTPDHLHATVAIAAMKKGKLSSAGLPRRGPVTTGATEDPVVRAIPVIPAAEERSSGLTTAMVYDWRVGTSI